MSQLSEDHQLTHLEVKDAKNHSHQPQVEVQLELWLINVSDVENVGGLFRLCDALNIRHIHLVGETPTPPDKKLTRVARHTEVHVPWTYYEQSVAIQIIETLKENPDNYLCGLEITSESLDLSKIHLAIHAHYENLTGSMTGQDSIELSTHRIHLFLGNEKHGLNHELVQLCHQCVDIPMLGHNSSMNVTQAAGIAAWTLLHNKD